MLRRLGESWVELLSTGEYDDPADSPDSAEQALDAALDDIERLTWRNESLRVRIEALEKYRKKLKRKLSAVA